MHQEEVVVVLIVGDEFEYSLKHQDLERSWIVQYSFVLVAIHFDSDSDLRNIADYWSFVSLGKSVTIKIRELEASQCEEMKKRENK